MSISPLVGLLPFRGQVRLIERIPRRLLREWIAESLHKRPAPRRLFSHSARLDVYPFLFVMQCFRASSSRRFRERFQACVEELLEDLLDEWDPSSNSHEYLMNLLAIIGLAGVKSARVLLVNLASHGGGQLKGIETSQGDLHLFLLRVLLRWYPSIPETGAPLQLDADILRICERDICEPRYATICYHALYEADTRKGIENLPDLLATTEEHMDSDPGGVLFHFLRHNSPAIAEETFYKGEEMSQKLQMLLASILVVHQIPLGRPEDEYVCWLAPRRAGDDAAALPDVVCRRSRPSNSLDSLWRSVVTERMRDPSREMQSLLNELSAVAEENARG